MLKLANRDGSIGSNFVVFLLFVLLCDRTLESSLEEGVSHHVVSGGGFPSVHCYISTKIPPKPLVFTGVLVSKITGVSHPLLRTD